MSCDATVIYGSEHETFILCRVNVGQPITTSVQHQYIIGLTSRAVAGFD